MAMKREYLSVDGEIFGEVTNGVVNFYDRDALGSVVAIEDGAGNTVSTIEYKPFGDVRTYTGENPLSSPRRFLWCGTWGYRFNERYAQYTSHYVRARHYSSLQGMWSTIDPLYPSERAYGYVGNRVIVGVDFSGKEWINPIAFPTGDLTALWHEIFANWWESDSYERSRDGWQYTYKEPFRIVRDINCRIDPCADCCKSAQRYAGDREVPYLAELRKHFGVEHDGESIINAIAHCHSACISAKFCGAQCAIDYLNGFVEGIDPMHYLDKNRMDSQNNLAGIKIGFSQEALGISFHGYSECLPACVFTAIRGELVVNDPPKNGMKFPPLPRSNNVGNWK